MSWTPEVTKVESVEKHPDADNLDIVKLYYDVITIAKIGTYKAGDLVSYIPIDTIPGDHSAFDFLGADRHKRIKAKRLRGIFSTGLVIPAPDGFKEGDSIVDFYGLTRYYSPFEKSEYITKDDLSLGLNSGCNERNPKHFEIPYYDLENIRKYGKLFENGENIVIAEKLEGENFSMIHDGERLWCKSRNYYKVKDVNSKWWDYPLRNDMESKLIKFPFLAFMGEYTGGVNGFRYDCQVKDGKVIRKFKLFDIYDTKEHKYLHYDRMQEIAKELELETAPELFRGQWTSLEDIAHLCERNSTLNPNHIMEGFVIRSLDRDVFFNSRDKMRAILKNISKLYALSKHS